jgi:DNA replication protein DnaC
MKGASQGKTCSINGCVKTYLSVAILRELMEKKGVACLLYESGSVLKEIQNSYNPISLRSRLFEMYKTVRIEVED